MKKSNIVNKNDSLGFEKLIKHLVVKCINIAGNDIDRAQALELLTNSGWEVSLEYMMKCFNDILAKHTDFSWHYEEDEGEEEDRVNDSYDYVRATMNLGKKLESLDFSNIYSKESLDVIGEGINVVSRGIFSSDYSVHETVIEALHFLSQNTNNDKAINKIDCILKNDKIKIRKTENNEI